MLVVLLVQMLFSGECSIREETCCIMHTFPVICCLTAMPLMIFEDMRNSSSLSNIPMLKERLIL